MFTRTTLIIMVAVAGLAAFAAHAQAPDAAVLSPADGWINLFDKETLFGLEEVNRADLQSKLTSVKDDAAIIEDRLDQVVDYGAITRKIRGLIGKGHVNLAETMAERIAALCFEDARVKTARVRVEKLHALPGAESAGVEIERTRPAR